VTTLDRADQISELYRLVGSDEIEASKNFISIDSPMAQALLGKSVDDEITVKTPSGDRYLTITDIKY
jgi:transcription elongation factor GreB